MSDLGKAYVQIVPSAKGIGGEISKSLGGEMESAGKSAGSSLASGIGAGLKLAGAAAIGATSAMTAFAKSSVEAGAGFDKSMSQVYATMGDKASAMVEYNGQTVTSMEALRDFAQEMGRTTAFSATQAADALNYMALAGYDADTSMNMLPNVLNLAAAGSMDLARASDMVTDTQTAFGISLERTTQMVDEMAKASSTGNTSVEQLGDAFLTVGGLAQELNGGFITLSDGTQKEVDGVQELEIALTAMANAGVKGSEAGTHMRNMLLKLSSPTDAGVKQLEALGVSVFDTEGNMRSLSDVFGDLSNSMSTLTQEQKIQAISDLFNTRDLASAEALLNAVSSDWDKIGESIVDAEGAASQMAGTQLDNLAGDVTLFQSALEGAKIAVSDALTPALRDFVVFGTEGLSTLTSAFKEGGLEGAMESFGDILSKGLNMVIEKLPDAVNAGMKLLSALGQGILDNLPAIIDAAVKIIQTLLTGLLGALPSLVDGALQIILGLADGITQMLPTLIPTIVEVVMQIVQTLIDNIPLLIEGAVQLILGLAQGLLNALPVLIERLPEIIQALVDALIEGLPILIQGAMQLVMGVMDALPEIISALVDALPEIINAVVNGLLACAPQLILGAIQLVLAIVAAMPEITFALIEAIPEIISTMVNAVVQNAPAFITAWGQIFTQIGVLITTYGSQFLQNVTTHMSNMLTTVVNWLKQLPEKIAYWLGAMLAKFVSFMLQLGPKSAEALSRVIQNVKNFGTKMITEGPRIAREFKEKLVNGIKEIPDKVKEIGGEIVEGLKNGISEKWTAMTGWIKELADNLIKGFKENLKIGSPSKVFEDEIGKWIPAGIAVGIENNQGILDRAVRNMTYDIVPYDSTGASIDQLGRTLNTSDQPVTVIVTLEGDANRLFRVMQSKATSNYRLTGNSSMVTV